MKPTTLLTRLLVASALCAPAGAALGQAVDPEATLPTDPAVTVGELDNGVRFYIRENPEPQARAELRLAIKAGSVLEDDDQLGLAHFVEHMAFNGTEHFEKQQLVDYMERIGMRFGPDVNAGTSFDYTSYRLQIPTDSAEIVATAFQILEDWAHRVSFDHEEIDKERGVVIEEWRLGQGAAARLQEKQFPILFKGSRYAERLPIGKKEVLESFDYDALKRFYREWYRPDLMAVIAVGDFDAAEIEERIRGHFGRIPAPDDAQPRPQFGVPDHEETLFAIASDPELTFNSVSVYWKQPLDEGNTVADYRRSIVETLYNAMLNQRLFELTQQADPPYLGAFSGQGRFIGAKEVYILGAGVKNNQIERGLKTLLTEAQRADRFGFTASELEREKRELLRNMQRAYDEREKTESADYASEYIRNFLYDEPFPGIEKEYELHQELSPTIRLDEVNRLASEWIVDENRVILVSVPEQEGIEVPTEEALLEVFAEVEDLELEEYEDVASDAPLVAEVPEPAAIVSEDVIEEIGVHRWQLGNGVDVWLKPTDFKDDEILFRALSPGGTSLAADSQHVAASTATSVVTQGGVGEFTLIELQKVLAGKAVRVSPFITNLSEGMSGSVSPADVETLFQLIYLYFTAPREDSTAFASFKTRVQAILENREADPTSAYRDTIQVTMSQHHFRARPLSQELYDEMDLTESFAFYQDRFADASDFSFFFVGAFQIDEMRPLIQRYLGGLPSLNRHETWRDEGIRPPEGVIEKVVYRGIEPKSQTQIIFTGPFEWSRENRYLLASLNQVMRIRLREVLREDMGGTYGVGVGGGGSRDPYPNYEIRITFGADPDRLEELTSTVFQQIDSLKAHGPTTEELEKVKEQQRRSRETDLRENSFWLSQLVSADLYDYDPRIILEFEEFVDGLTIEALQAAAATYFDTDNYVRVSLYPEDRGGGS